ncbi:TIGR02301 family protein [Chelativorans sp. AA-79]|uniref:TIGR02301 family protein n=1 Tax=Chelativorans sp. AA-79 TaxID=3028735 RepID=UPI0023F9BA8E|nr:TIGR02301 family protein [Chelativorans sp. AA-79]WEX07659.1 TIGR02301 family protein [Chelativorans sp. AA-79]
MKALCKLLTAGATAMILSLSPAAAQAPYDPQLMRLAEVLGSVHFLRGLCGEKEGVWRAQMEALLDAEAPSEERRAKLVASFNRGYRSFAGVYTSCTDSALQAIDRYMKEGETLTNEITLRYGN